MKKLLIVLAIVLMASVAQAQTTKQLTFTWTQVLPSPNDLAGWHMSRSSVAGGPYTLFATVPFTTVQTTYTSVQTLSVPQGSSTHCFVLDAYDTTGNRSANSNEICRTITVDTVAPAIPQSFNLTVQ